MRESAKVFFSLDLDGTLLYHKNFLKIFDKNSYELLTAKHFYREISPVNMYALKKAQEFGNPTGITTARTIPQLIQDTIKDFRKLTDEKQLKFYPFYLEGCSFQRVLSVIEQNGLKAPSISTGYDPLLDASEEIPYYQKYDQMIEYISVLIDKSSYNRDELINHFTLILQAMEWINIDAKEIKIEAPLPNEFKKIIPIIYQEKELLKKFRSCRSECVNKQHQFKKIYRETLCNFFVHVDDFSQIYKAYEQEDLSAQTQAIPFKYHTFKTDENQHFYVYCIPFQSNFENYNIILAAIFRGLNFPIEQLQKKLQEFGETLPKPVLCCRIKLWSWNYKERTTIRNVLQILPQITIQVEEKQNDAKELSSPRVICCSTHQPLLEILNQIPFDKLQSLHNPSLKKLQTELTQFQENMRNSDKQPLLLLS